MKSNYVDIPSIIQVIGGIYNNPELIDNEKYHFYEEDFPEEFHKILFGSIYNLYLLGAKEIRISNVEDFLKTRPKQYAIYRSNNGSEYLTKISQNVQLSAFDYYYNRMKKMTLFRMYEQSAGMDLSWLYDVNNILNVKKKQAQEEWLDNTSLEKIAEVIDNKINDIKLKYIDNNDNDISHASKGALALLEELKRKPDVGCPLYGPIINTITRGARLGKLYLRSASTGAGKTRSMVADCCNIGCDELYDITTGKWIKNGTLESCLFISTELGLDEVQTMMIAFIADVEEDHILNGFYTNNEWDRVCHAVEILERSHIQVQLLFDFSLKDLENSIKIAIREHSVKYVFFDYLHSSLKILTEISSKANNIKGLREDNILFMISAKLKDLCNEYGIFILSSTQLNNDYKTATIFDQSLLRGAKAIADRIDIGWHILKVSQDDIVSLAPILGDNGFETPALKMPIYKNRRGKYNNIILWCRDRRGVCKIEPLFATTYDYELIQISDLRIEVEESAF